MGGWVGGWMDGWVDGGWMDRWVDGGWMGGWSESLFEDVLMLMEMGASRLLASFLPLWPGGEKGGMMNG